jgi:hypothetical protein
MSLESSNFNRYFLSLINFFESCIFKTFSDPFFNNAEFTDYFLDFYDFVGL